MPMRDTDSRLIQCATRLKLSWTRDHLLELINTVTEAKMTPREVLDYCFSKEIEQREENRIKLANMAAHFPPGNFTLEQFDMTAQPSLDPGIIRELETMEWAKAGENVLFLGPPGVGKTHLAIGLAKRAIGMGMSARFYTAETLLAILEKAQKEGILAEKINEINKFKVIVIDEVGYLSYPATAGHLMFQLVSKRYQNKSIIVTGNRPPGEWGLIFGDSTAATAILDRLLHHSTTVTIRGDSYRIMELKKRNAKRKLPKSSQWPPAPASSAERPPRPHNSSCGTV